MPDNITLDTSGKIEIVLDGAITTNQLEWTSSYFDRVGTTSTPGDHEGLTNDTTNVDVVTSPASGARIVKEITVYNADTVAATGKIIKDNGVSEFIIDTFSLDPGGVYSMTGGVGGGGGTSSPLTNKGDLWGYDTDNNRVPIGTNDQRLTADSGETLGLKWANDLVIPLDYASVVNSTSKTTMAEVTVPQDVLSTNKAAILLVAIKLKNTSGSSRTFTTDVEWGSTNICTGALTIGTNRHAILEYAIYVQNDGAANSQITGVVIKDAATDDNAAAVAVANLSSIATGAPNPGTLLSVYDTAAENNAGGDLTLKLSITLGFASANYEALNTGAYAIVPI
jgi:hypothetical protein